MAFAVRTGSNRGNFPNGIATATGCAMGDGGALSVRFNTAASGRAIIGVAGRDCFGLGNSPSGRKFSRMVCVGTSGFAPTSSLCVPANRVGSMRKAPVSFHAPARVNGGTSCDFSRVGGTANCSRG